MTDRLNPEALDQEALEAAAKALRDDHANRAEYYVVPEWNDTPYGQKLVFRGKARAAVSAYLAALPAPRTITTVEELDALPVGSVIADLYDDRGDAPVVLCKANNGEWAALTTGTRKGIPWWASRDIAHVARRLRFLHVPTEGGGE